MLDRPWLRTGAGWWVRSIPVGKRYVFVALMRRPGTWKWIGYGNGKLLGDFDGLALAKKKAPQVARALEAL